MWQITNQKYWFGPSRMSSVHCHIASLQKYPFRIKYRLIPYNIVTGTGQFVCDRFSCYDRVGFNHLSLIVPLHVLVMPQCMVCSLYLCPGQVLITVFTVSFSFDFFVRKSFASHAPAIGCIVPYLLKPLYGTCLIHDGQGKNLVYARYRHQ